MESSAALDLAQLREITLNDVQLMRTVLTALLDDTAEQMPRLERAISARDAQACACLAHYSKSACASAGAAPAAEALRRIESMARSNDLEECRRCLTALASTLEGLREESRALLGGEQRS